MSEDKPIESVPPEEIFGVYGFDQSVGDIAKHMLIPGVDSYRLINERVQEPDLEFNLTQWQSRLDRLEAEMPTLVGKNEWPQWFYDEKTVYRNVVDRQVKESGTYQSVARYLELYERDNKVNSAIAGRERHQHRVGQVISNLGENTVGKALAQEPVDGSIHKALLEEINSIVANGEVLMAQLRTLKYAYNAQTITDLLGISGDSFSDSLKGLLRSKTGLKWIRHIDNPYNGDKPYGEYRKETNRWIAQAIHAINRMPVEEAMSYGFSASRRTDDEDISKVINAFDYFGADRIRAITASTGIYGLESYTIEQLERMERFTQTPDKIAEELQSHDVMVMMVNRVGDHNGVMGRMASDFDDDAGRTLFFEIKTIDDIYRNMLKLKKVGIQPSTLVLGAHSAPGRFTVSDLRDPAQEHHNVATISGQKLVEEVNAKQEAQEATVRGFSMHGMYGMARVVDELMAPSRSIDDAPGDAGHKKIIFQACDAGTETEQRDLDESGEKVQIGTESVISQLAKDLVASGIKSKVDIFGAPAGIQMHRTESGVRYSGQPEGLGMGRTELHAERMRIINGRLIKDVIEDIVLRKAQ
jgi:hypothetical protein